MNSLTHYPSEKIQIVQPSLWKRVYELRTEHDVLMTMSYPKWYSQKAVVEGLGGSWEFSNPSIWRMNLDIKRTHDQLPFAKFIAEKWKRGGTFELPNGGRILYASNGWKGTNELVSHQKIRLITFTKESIFKSAVTVTVELESELLTAHPWIIMATYHHILERNNRRHAAV